MIFRNRVAKMKLVKQLTLVTLQTAHHGSTSPRIASTQRNHASRPVSTDFCNKICQKRTLWPTFPARQLWANRAHDHLSPSTVLGCRCLTGWLWQPRIYSLTKI